MDSVLILLKHWIFYMCCSKF